MSKMTVCKTCEKEVAKSAKICPHCGAKLKGGKLKFILGGVVALIVILTIAFPRGSSTKNIDLVKNGHLGNYKTVTISKMLDTNYKNSNFKWDAFESNGKNIVEVKIEDTKLNKKLLMQFSINSDNTFNVAHVNLDGQAFEESYDVKLLLDGLYQNYADITSDKSIVIDTNTSNDTLKGTK